MTKPTTATETLQRGAVTHRARGVTLVCLSALAFGTAGVCAKGAARAAGPSLTPLRLVEFRVTGAAVIFVVITLVIRARGNQSNPRMRWDRSAVATIVVYGLIAFLGVQALYFVAIQRLPVGVALLIEYLAPALVALYAVFVQRRRQGRPVWVGIGLSLVGLALIARPWAGFTLDGLGTTAALVAAVALAGYFLIAEATGDRIPGLELCTGAAVVAALVSAVVLPWWSFPWHTLSRTTRLAGAATPVWVLLTIVVVIGTVAAYLCGIAALRYLPAPVVAVLATLEVVVASLAAWVLLDERLGAGDLIGGSVLLGGAVLAQWRPAEPEPAAMVIDGIVTP